MDFGNSIADAEAVMPKYCYSSDFQTPAEFIQQGWRYTENDAKANMIEYIEEHPFNGCERYVEEWNSLLEYYEGL